MKAIISSIQKANADNGAEDTPKKSNASQAGNAFGGKESAKRSKTEWLAALSCALAAYQSTMRRAAPTIHRTISSLHHTYIQTARCELDSHADTCALGSNFSLLHYTGWVCDVAPYNSEAYNPECDIPIVTAATSYQYTKSWKTTMDISSIEYFRIMYMQIWLYQQYQTCHIESAFEFYKCTTLDIFIYLQIL